MASIKYKEAAGIEAKRGKPSLGKKPSKAELRRLYIKESKSIREVAEILGCTKDMVYRALQEFGIERRSCVRRSQLKDIRLSVLEREIRRKGIRGYARELEVNESTLRHHLKKRRSTGLDA
jgi:DNA invertase Pin-like site-specific DNA recombinase